MSDIFGRNSPNITAPLIADNVTINWGGVFADAAQVTIGAAQPITRRRTIGNQKALIYAGQTSGNISIMNLMSDDTNSIFSLPGWNVCDPTSISITASSCSGGNGLNVTAIGCVVSQWSASAEAEGETVIGQINIDFLQLLNS